MSNEDKQLNLGDNLTPPTPPATPETEAERVERDRKGRFQHGHQNLGGRPAGSKNKRSGAIDEIFSSNKHNACERLIWLSKRIEGRLVAYDKIQEEIIESGGKVAPQDALREDEQLFYQANKTLLEYQYPKLRAIEVSASRFSGVQFVINAGGEKTKTGSLWVEESLEENLAIAEERAALREAEEKAKNE